MMKQKVALKSLGKNKIVVVLIFLLFVFTGCKDKTNTYMEFDVFSRGTYEKIKTIKSKNQVNKLNRVLNSASEIEYLKSPMFNYILICRNNLESDTLYISNNYIGRNGKWFKTSRSIYKIIGISNGGG